jgi:SulP family sulfate permease
MFPSTSLIHFALCISCPEAKTYPEALILRFDARLYYADIPFLEEHLISTISDRPDLKYIVIDCRGINSIDVTALEGLENLIAEYKSRGINIVFTNTKKQVRERLLKSGLGDKFGDISYPTTRDALRDISTLKDPRARSR